MLLLVTSGTISTAAATAAAASLRILCAIQQRKRTAVCNARAQSSYKYGELG